MLLTSQTKMVAAAVYTSDQKTATDTLRSCIIQTLAYHVQAAAIILEAALLKGSARLQHSCGERCREKQWGYLVRKFSDTDKPRRPFGLDFAFLTPS